MDYGKVSVIVPIYKTESYLDRCIQSIVDQTYKNLEIILVDDGSPDHCPAICDAWAAKDDRVRVVHKPNGGISSARNAGLDAHTGVYVVFVDSDDWIENTMIETLVGDVVEYDVDFSGCAYCKDQNDATFATIDLHFPNQVYHSRDLMDDYFERDSFFFLLVWAKVYRSSLIGDTRFNEEVNASEDVEFIYQLVKKHPSAVVDSQVLYHYVMSEDSITRSVSGSGQKWLDNVRVNASIFDEQSVHSFGWQVAGAKLIEVILAAVYHLTYAGSYRSAAMQQITQTASQYNRKLCGGGGVKISVFKTILWKFYILSPSLFCKMLKVYFFLTGER